MKVKLSTIRQLVKEEMSSVPPPPVEEADLDEAGKSKKKGYDPKKFAMDTVDELGIELGEAFAAMDIQPILDKVVAEAQNQLKLPGAPASVADAFRQDEDKLIAAMMKRVTAELKDKLQTALWDLDDILGGAPPEPESDFDRWKKAVWSHLLKIMPRVKGAGDKLEDVFGPDSMLKDIFRRGDDAETTALAIKQDLGGEFE